MVRLRSLGTIDLRNAQGDELRAVLVQPRRLALLVALALTRPSGFQRRDRLAALFWPEESADRARAALSRAIYFLRGHLGDDVIVSRGAEEIGINRARFASDAEAFNHALDSGNPAGALDLYGGELLPAFFASGAPGFEEWLESEREFLRARAASAAAILAAASEAGDDLSSAIRWARRAADLAPFDEVAVRRLLRILDRSGDRGGATSYFREFTRNLETQLGVTPAPETRSLADAIKERAAETRPAPSAPPVAPLDPGSTRPPASLARRRVGRLTLATVAAMLIALPWVAKQAEVDAFRVDVGTFAPAGVVRSREFGDSVEREMFDALVQARLVRATRESPARSGWRFALPVDSLKGRRRGRIAALEVSGSWHESRGVISVQARVTDRRGEGRQWNITDSAPVDSGRVLVARVAQRVAGAVAVLGNAYYASLLLPLGPPPRIEAWQEFMAGSGLEMSARQREAVEHYRVAAALDPAFTWPIVQAAISATTSPDPYGPWADSVLAEARHARERLAPLERNLADYAFAIRAADWEKCYRAIRGAAAIAPEQFSYMEAVRATSLHRPGDAVAALRRPALSRMATMGAQPYWMLLTSSYHALGEHRTELEAVRSARTLMPGNPTLRMQELKALAALGMIDQVMSRLDSLTGLREDWITPGAALTEVAAELRAHGHEAAATDTFGRAIAWFRQRPAAEAAMENHQYYLGAALYLAGELDAADSVFRILRRRNPDETEYLGFLGAIAARRGDLVAVRRVVAQLRVRKPVAPLPGEGSVVWRATIEALSGNRSEAMRLLVETFGPNGTLELHTNHDFDGMRNYAPFREFIRPKG
jgi:DNA-binding SARP family transcriptional activator